MIASASTATIVPARTATDVYKRQLTVDVSDPAATEVFVAGLSKGPLAQAQTPLARIAD